MRGNRYQSVAQRKKEHMQKTKRDPLVGNFFIIRDERGEARQAGRINSKTESGDYIVRVTFNDDGSPQYGETVSPPRLTAESWLLFTNESSWRTAFAAMRK